MYILILIRMWILQILSRLPLQLAVTLSKILNPKTCHLSAKTADFTKNMRFMETFRFYGKPANLKFSLVKPAILLQNAVFEKGSFLIKSAGDFSMYTVHCTGYNVHYM